MNETTRNSLNLITTNRLKHKQAHKESRRNTQLSKHRGKKTHEPKNPKGHKNQIDYIDPINGGEKGRKKLSTDTL